MFAPLTMAPLRVSYYNAHDILDSEAQKKSFEDDPESYLEYRKAVEIEMNPTFAFVCVLTLYRA